VILEAIGITLLAFIASVFVGVVFLIPLLGLGYGLDSMLVILGVAVLGQVGFLVVAYLYIRSREIKVPIDIPSKSDLKYLSVGTISALLTAAVLSRILSLLNLMPESVIEDIASTDPSFLLALAFLSVVLIAPAEELLFRGAIQGRLRECLGVLPSVIGASILFGSLHLGNYTGEIYPIISAVLLIAVIGGILGVLYERTRNLTVPIAVHAIYNVFFLLISYLAIV